MENEMDVNCDKCGVEIKKRASLLFLMSPPDDEGNVKTKKVHLCTENGCYREELERIRVMFFGEDL
jgi:hypothetical protein